MRSSHSGSKADVAMIGLAVMGRNLALNMADHGFRVAVNDLSVDTVREFVTLHPDTPGGLVAVSNYGELVASLTRPRRIVMMIKAGAPVDEVKNRLAPLLDRGDVVVDGGNSLWTDTERRVAEYTTHGLHFVGSGVSGGEEGARFGPSLMPGGDRRGGAAIAPIWNAISAKVDAKSGRPLGGAVPGRPVVGGEPCSTWVGSGGAGHFVKMVHNGIEYADMQLISEAYGLLRGLLELKNDAIAEIFDEWNAGELDSFLIEITSEILRQPDPRKPARAFVDAVLDAAGQKGTGKWTAIHALDVGVAAPSIAEAVFARVISAARDERLTAARRLVGPKTRPRVTRRKLIEATRDALYASKICAYAQGFALLAAADRERDWKLDFGAIARIWRGGCIIRARFLQKIADAYDKDSQLPNLMLDPYFRRKLASSQEGWREVAALAARSGAPCPAVMSSLAYYDGYRSNRLPTALLQAQRDYFGSHGYERIDEPRGKLFHLTWPEKPRRERPL